MSTAAADACSRHARGMQVGCIVSTAGEWDAAACCRHAGRARRVRVRRRRRGCSGMQSACTRHAGGASRRRGCRWGTPCPPAAKEVQRHAVHQYDNECTWAQPVLERCISDVHSRGSCTSRQAGKSTPGTPTAQNRWPLCGSQVFPHVFITNKSVQTRENSFRA